MKFKFLFLGMFVASILFVVSCGDDTNDTTDETENNSTSNTNLDEPFTYYGIVADIEDSGIPYLFNFVIETDDGIESLNYEGDYESAAQYIGQEVKVKYDESYRLSSMDILYDSSSLYGEYGGLQMNGGEPMDDWFMVVGEFYADEVSGDTPGVFSIREDNGNEFYFEAFIDETMIEYNYFEVTVYYREDIVQTITSIE